MKKILLLVLFFGTALCMADLSNLSNQGCEDDTGVWRCHMGAKITQAEGIFDGEIGCLSTNETYVDKWCYAVIELQKPVTIDDCTFSVTDDKQVVYNECENNTLIKGTLMFALIDPQMTGNLDCKETLEDTIYVTVCQVNNTRVIFDGGVSLLEEDPTVMITKMDVAGSDWGAFILKNLAYIILIIIIIAVVGYLVLAPRKQVISEKKAILKNAITKRERRYGRKI